jgi:palmitoyltransferase ZDHHC9/14/18
MTTILSKSFTVAHAFDTSNFVSPFSQKNIQECRCGTEACRGVLGPKPKKPVEEKSVTSALITGTKRKLQDLLGSKRAGSESSHNSPKKRKLFNGTSATTKAQNAMAESESARERAEREASDLSRQNASREDRALKRSTSGNLTKPSGHLQTNRSSAIKVTSHISVDFPRSVPGSGALKATKKSSSPQYSSRRTTSMLSSRRGLRSLHRPGTPVRGTSTEVSGSEEDASPNITPASLRSARKPIQVSPIRQELREEPDTNSEKDRIARTSPISGSKLQQRGRTSARTSDNPELEGAMAHHSAQSRSRSGRGR